MTNILSLIRITIYWMAISYIYFTIYLLTIAQFLPYELVDMNFSYYMYGYIIPIFPIAVLLTLTGSLKKSYSKRKNISTIISTIIVTLFSCVIMFFLYFLFMWVIKSNDVVLFKHKSKPNITITNQILGVGGFGDDGHRIVKLEPFLYFWNQVTIIDTSKINKAEWIPVNKKSSK